MNETNNSKELLIALRRGDILSERSGEYWIEEEREKMMQMFWAGEGISNIALYLQRSENAIIQQLILYRMLTPPRDARSGGERKRRCPSGNEACPHHNGGYCHAGTV